MLFALCKTKPFGCLVYNLHFQTCHDALDGIHRFYANDSALHGHKKAVLILAMADDTMESADGAIASFRGMTKFLDWEIAGTVVGVECADVDALQKTDYPAQAYELGKNL